MRKHYLPYCALGAALLLLAVSCKKKDNDAPSCRIISATEVSENGLGMSSTSNYQFTYDSKKRLISSVRQINGGATYYISLAYGANTIIATYSSSAAGGTVRDSVSLNNKGQITNICFYYGVTNDDWINMRYEYEYAGGKLLRTINSSSTPGSSPVTSNVTVQNGDVVTIDDGMDPESYEYFTDKAFRLGDPLHFASFISYGQEITPNAHLLKRDLSSADTIDYSYDIDTDERIVKVTATSTASGITTTSYQYQCD